MSEGLALKPYTTTTTTLGEAHTLPIGLPVEGQLHHNYAIKGLSAGGRRKLSLLFSKTSESQMYSPELFYDAVNTILKDGLLEVGPYKREQHASGKAATIPGEVLGTLTSIDREFLAWKIILDNYTGEFADMAIHDITIPCECGESCTASIDPNTMECVYPDPAFWRVEDQLITYDVEHRGKEMTVIVPNGRIEKSLPSQEDVFGRLMAAIAQLVKRYDGKTFPFTPKALNQMSCLVQDQISRAMRLDPIPGLDSIVQIPCDRCGRMAEGPISFLPFLSAGV